MPLPVAQFLYTLTVQDKGLTPQKAKKAEVLIISETERQAKSALKAC